MAKDDEVIIDENGIEVKSAAAKWLSPMPAPEDLVRVATGAEVADYMYVDPASLFAAERLVAKLRENGKGFVKSQCTGFKKFVREVVEAGYAWWPLEGYVQRTGVSAVNAVPTPATPMPEPAVDPSLAVGDPDEEPETVAEETLPQPEPMPAGFPGLPTA